MTCGPWSGIQRFRSRHGMTLGISYQFAKTVTIVLMECSCGDGTIQPISIATGSYESGRSVPRFINCFLGSCSTPGMIQGLMRTRLGWKPPVGPPLKTLAWQSVQPHCGGRHPPPVTLSRTLSATQCCAKCTGRRDPNLAQQPTA